MKSSMKNLGLISVVVSGLALPVLANAAGSASVAFANMYLWRGQNLTPDGPAISGSLDYKHESGAYAGIWGSSENKGMETDLYAGFAKSFGAVGVDVSYYKYLYPQERPESSPGVFGPQLSLSETDASEVVVGVSSGPVTFKAFIGVESDLDANNYFTLSGTQGKFSALIGKWILENPGDAKDPAKIGLGDEYAHIQFGYQATDNLSFAVSKAISSDADLTNAVEEDPLFLVNYALSFDLAK